MSTGRRRRATRRSTTTIIAESFDLDGNRHEHPQRVRQFASLGAIPAHDRLVDVVDDCQQLATLVHAGDDPPLLYVPQVGSPAPAHALVGDKLAAALVFVGSDGPRVAIVGTPRASCEVWCDACRSTFEVGGADLQDKRDARPGRRTPRLYVH